MEEPVWKEHDLQLVGREPLPVIDVSYVELPERLTHRVNLGSVLGALAGGRMLDLVGADVLLPCISAVSALGTVVTIAGAQSPRPDRR